MTEFNPPEPSTVRLGISSCLLGEEVRFNGGHSRDDFLMTGLGPWVEWISVCPEVEMGLGVPRESLRLVGSAGNPRLVAPKSGSDHTEAMVAWSEKRIEELAGLDLHGFVLKRASPSCGLFRVKVYDDNDVPSKDGRGIFARELARALPLLPLEEEGRLEDSGLRENFVERIFAYYRWTKLREDPDPGALVAFHTVHKLTLMSHEPRGLKLLGQLVADAGSRELEELLDEYGELFMSVLETLATARKHTNVLQHILGFLKDDLDGGDKQEILDLIELYRLGRVPLVVPLTLFRHHLRRHDVPDWLRNQVYLDPYPTELMLRNHV